MKILVVADIHANYRALKATLDAFDNVDEVWCLGDIVEYGPMPSACIDFVRQHCDQVVVGNHDLSFAKCQPQADDDWTVWFPHNTSINNLDYLNNLPTLLTLERDGISYCLVHGSPSNHLTGRFHPYTEEAENRQNLQYPDQDRILAGHIHMACNWGPFHQFIQSNYLIDHSATHNTSDNLSEQETSFQNGVTSH